MSSHIRNRLQTKDTVQRELNWWHLMKQVGLNCQLVRGQQLQMPDQERQTTVKFVLKQIIYLNAI